MKAKDLITSSHDTHAEYQTHYSGERDTCVAHIRRYGHWNPCGDEGALLIPAYLSGSDYSGSLVERANARAWSEQFAAGDGAWWTEVGGGYGTFAIVIDCEAIPEDVESDVRDFFAGLANYPCADDDLHSEMEMEAQDEAWKDWARADFVKALEAKFETDLDEVSDTAVAELFHDACERSNTYWENEQGDSMWIDIKRIVAEINALDVADLKPGIITGVRQ